MFKSLLEITHNSAVTCLEETPMHACDTVNA